jgi:inhibitor of KinA sporulation pathway (predicted exonuclease)
MAWAFSSARVYSAVVTADDLVARTRAQLRRAGGAILFDLEFTCWEDSLRTQWADPARPCEVIEIGMSAYDVAKRAIGASFTALVRPVVNPTLSPYCLDLLHIPQMEIDDAADLPAVLGGVAAWLRTLPHAGLPTCGWGENDRVRLAANAGTLGTSDPLASRPHIDLRAVMTALYPSVRPMDRDALRGAVSLPENPRRHRALDDALDLTHFLDLLLKDG